ncbi:hypothetical protein EJ04DRAFT_182573 [Polyplosphaeria fusca]|uniref:Uncharacterized protein n=1 Tax=Polyplosphaeria fusca TaxID=682080 RepID=A0A9P4R3P8_9PLEO|nr:hypothetical protein EJ04DRAFT_182573 [Polyplosphaeria fusca]
MSALHVPCHFFDTSCSMPIDTAASWGFESVRIDGRRGRKRQPSPRSCGPRHPASIPSADGTCHLFRLPRELLDIIYEFALTEDQALFSLPTTDRKIAGGYSRQSKKLFLCKFGHKEANRIKYTCKKLFFETRGLSIRYNVITFARNDYIPSHAQFFHFLKHCSPRITHRIRVEIVDWVLASPGPPTPRVERWSDIYRTDVPSAFIDSLHELLGFCATHPNARIIYRTCILSNRDHGLIFLIRAIALVAALRNVHLAPTLLPHPRLAAEVDRMMNKIRGTADVSVPNLSNLRIMPLETEFDVGEFINGLYSGSPSLKSRVWRVIIGRNDDKLEQIIEMIGEWHMRGI